MDGSYTIVKSMDGDGEVRIEWPQMLSSDDALVAFVQDLRKFGLATSTKIDNTTGRMIIFANKVKAIYQRGLYQESILFEGIWASDNVKDAKPVTMPEPKPAWFFQEEVVFHPGPLTTPTIYTSPPKERDYADLAHQLSKHIPDIRKNVPLPCSCGKRKKAAPMQVWLVIQHLNDDHHPDHKVNGRRRKDIWTRERIADWLDEVDADLTFDPDLPAKRAAAREAARKHRKEQAEQLINQTNAALLTATSDLQKEFGAIGQGAIQAQKGMVKFNVALSEYIQQLKDDEEKWTSPVYQAGLATVNEAFATCECDMCKTTEEES